MIFWLRVAIDETTTTTAYDTVEIQIRNSSNAVVATLATYSNPDKGSTYMQRTFDVSAYKTDDPSVLPGDRGVAGGDVVPGDAVSLVTQ